MSITFYSMPGCGFCVKAKNLFAAELASGEMIVLPSSQAPKGTTGFPTFTANGMSHTGLPSSKAELYNKLGVREKYQRNNRGNRGNFATPSFFGVY
jgi:glutaredoxin